VDEAVSIKALKRFVADYAVAQDKETACVATPSEKTGKVAVVGAGPAGLTCAYFLALKGHAVTVYEALNQPGGMSFVGIPDYRLPPRILQQEVAPLMKLGVTFHFSQTVGKDVSLDWLDSHFDAVFIGIGAQESVAMGIEGETGAPLGFFQGLFYLREINEGRDPYPEGKHVVVIGGGNVAIDCARSSVRLQKQVHLIYRRSRDAMPADASEIRDAEEEAVCFHFLTAPARIVSQSGRVVGLECVRMEIGAPDSSGRPRPVPVDGSNFIFECDTVVSAVGQQVDLVLLEGAGEIETTSRKTFVVDPDTKQSRKPNFFFAGDCETGPDSLITACAGGRKAAFQIDRRINGIPLESDAQDHFDRFFQSVKVFDPRETISKVDARPRLNPRVLSAAERTAGFDEVEQGFSVKEAVAEAERCLRCYQVATLVI